MDATEDLVLDAAARLFRETFTTGVLAAADAGAWPAEAWDAVAAFGLPLALVDEAHGGVGLAVPEAFAIIRESGRIPVPLPLAETMIANRLLVLAGLPPAAGPACLAFDGGVRAGAASQGWRISGPTPRVPWGRLAGIVAVAQRDGDVVLARVPRHGCEIAEGSNIANEPRDTLRFDCLVRSDDVAALPAGLGLADVFAMHAAARCCQMAGAMEQVCELTIAYARDRRQFGRPLAKFQAIQQNLAVLAASTAAARAAADLAVEAMSTTPLRPAAVAAAKVRVGEAAGLVAGIAHQVHGAIGFTHEHRLHHLTRRLWSWREEFGNEAYWSAELGRAMARAGEAGLWPAVTAV